MLAAGEPAGEQVDLPRDPPTAKSIPELINVAFKSADQNGARAAWTMLGKIARAEDLRALLPVLESPRDIKFDRLQTQIVAMTAIIDVTKRTDSAQNLVGELEILRASATSIGKLRAIELLQKIPGPAARNQLFALMQEKDPEVRRCAIAALDFTASPAILDQLRKALSDSDLELKKAAILALGRCKRLEDVSRLIPLIDSKEKGVKPDATWAIHNIAGREFDSADQAKQWVDAKTRSGDEDITLLLAELRNAPIAQRPLIVEDLAHYELHRDRILPEITQFLRDGNPRLRAAVCDFMGRGVPSNDTLARLVESLRDNSDMVSATAWRSLKNLTTQNLPRDHAAWRAWLDKRG